jgi:hypothetical protein
VILKGLYPAERAHMHQAVEDIGFGLDGESAYDGGVRVMVIGARRDVARLIAEIDERNDRRAPMHLFPGVAEYYRTGGRLEYIV